MKTYTLNRQQLVQQPLKEVFNFFSQIENLSIITPDYLDFSLLTPLPIKMKVGTLVDYTVKPMLFPLRWTAMITEYEPPYKFIDQQLKGPYSFWHHTHTFKDTSEGTLITDEVVYALPFGIIGEIVHSVFVRNKLRKIFDYRISEIKKYFENNNNRSKVLN